MLSSTIVLTDSPKPNLNGRQDISFAWTGTVKHHSTLEPSAAIDHASHPTVSLVMKSIVTPSATGKSIPKITNTFFASPLRTLSESIMDPGQHYITTHDLVEAYNLLSARIRTVMNAASPTDDSLSCLAIFKEQSGNIEQCLSRDLHRLLPSPFDSQHHLQSYSNRYYYSQDSMDDDDLTRITDNVILCQFALRLSSDIFTFPIVYAKFTDSQLASLLRDVLLVCTTTSRPIPNSHKSSALAIWALKSQQLPTSILYSVAVPILSALKHAIAQDVAGSTGKLDAFKAVHHILTKHSSFFDLLIDLLPSILDHLNDKSLEVRMFAALAVSGFAAAKCNLVVATTPYQGTQVFDMVETYINEQCTRRTSLQSKNLLPTIFKSAFAGEPFWKGYGPSFTMVLTSSLLVLLDRFIYSSPRPLKLVFKVLEQCTQQRSNVRALHPELWRIVIWVFSRFMAQDYADEHTTIREPTFRVTSQDPRHGIGLALIAVLLQQDQNEEATVREAGRVEKAITVVADLVKSKEADSRDDGVQALDRLLSHIGTSTPSNIAKRNGKIDVPFSRTLIDGSLLFQDARIVSITPVLTSIEEISPLSEEEVLKNWDALSDAWISATQTHLGSGQELSPALLQIWQALLLVRSDLTQEHHHLSAPPAFAASVTSIINGFTAPLETTETQIGYLTFIGKLWAVLKNVFTFEWLSKPAGIIMTALLEKEFTLSDNQVKEAWSRVYADLISVDAAILLHVAHQRSEDKQGIEVTRLLWNILGQSDAVKGDDWKENLHFLAIPFGVWDLSDPEFDLWEAIYSKVLGISVDIPDANAVTYFMALVGGSKLKQCPRIVWSILSQSLCASVPITDTGLIGILDELLFCYYPTGLEQGDRASISLEPLRLMADLVSKLTEFDIIDFLSTTHRSLSCWIIDKLEILDTDQHDEVLATFYKRPLDLLCRLAPSLAVLNRLADFISSVFVRVRGDGPFIFHAFWQAGYHLCTDIPKNDYPDIIKACLKAWSDIYEDSMGDGISLDSESQLEEVPDSQPDYPDKDPVFEIEQNWVNERAVNNGESASQSHGPATPVQRGRKHSSTETHATQGNRALRALQDYNSFADEESLRSPEVGRSTSNHRNISPLPSMLASTSKHSLEIEAHHVSKRRRIEAPRIDFKPRAGKEKAREPSTSSRSAKGSTTQLKQLRGQRVSETPSWLGSDLRKFQLPSHEHEDNSLVFEPPSPMRSSDDYDMWEKAISIDVLKAVQSKREEDSDFLIPDTEDNPYIEEEGGDTEAASDVEDDSGEKDVLSPSLGEYPLRSRRRYRSQTAPEPLTESHLNSDSSARPLRRNQTTPIPDKKAFSAQLDALQRAYATVADSGVSQIDVQEIMQARRLANQINQVLDEQMCLKLTTRKHGFDD